MKRKNAKENYRLATLAIYAALKAPGRTKPVDFLSICKAHQISTSFPATLRKHAIIQGRNGSAFWDPEFGLLDPAVIEELRVEHCAAMLAKKKAKKPEPKTETPTAEEVFAPVMDSVERIGQTIDNLRPTPEQTALPFSVSENHQFLTALEGLHKATGDMLEAIRVKA